MDFLFGLTFRLVLSAANLRTWNVTILDERFHTDLYLSLGCSLGILYEAILLIVFITLLLLLGVVAGFVGSVTSGVVGVVTGHYFVIFCLFLCRDLVYTSLSSCRDTLEVCGHSPVSSLPCLPLW